MAEEHHAAVEWSRITEGADQVAYQLVERYGYAEALDRVRKNAPSTSSERVSFARWRARLDKPYDVGKALDAARILIPSDPDWPARINDLGPEAPLALWVRGASADLNVPAVSIVGSRDSSDYGDRLARDLAFDLANQFAIISGGAFGIDAQAHHGALRAGGRTIIVSAAGVDRFYPRAHADLYLEVLRRGAVLSESPPGSAPHRHRFLSRNRIIAALGLTTVVVEAPLRSGALSTARHAMNIGRDVGAFPGPVTSDRSTGCHWLIRNGGMLVTSPGEVAEMALPIGHQLSLSLEPDPGSFTDPIMERVWEAIPLRTSAPATSIARVAGLTIRETSVALGKLELAGRVSSRDGAWQRS